MGAERRAEGRPAARNRVAARILVSIALWCLGIWTVFAPMIDSGLDLTIAGLGDPRLVNFGLEHSYRWLIGDPMHETLWSPPIFHPKENVAAYTEPFLGVAPLYWLGRAFGAAPDTAFQLWILLVWSINFVAAYAFLSIAFRLGALGAGAGAYLFAFGAPRTLNMGHQQLIPAFFIIAAIAALFWMFGTLGNHGERSWLSCTLFVLAIVAQVYTAVYPAFYLGLGLVAACLWGTILPMCRRRMKTFFLQNWRALVVASLLGVVLVWPLADGYLKASQEVGPPPYAEENVPRIASWLLMGPRNVLYGWLQTAGPFTHLRRPFHSNGVGFLTLMLAGIGLWWARPRRAVVLIVLSVLTLFAISTRFPGGFSLWPYVYAYVPGAAALRAIGRIGMVLTVPAAIGIGAFFDRFARSISRQLRCTDHRPRAILSTAVLVVLFVGLLLVTYAEQLNRYGFIDKHRLRRHVGEIAERVPSECRAFLLVLPSATSYRHVHDDAAWVALRSRTPTVNGRYGRSPPGWNLHDVGTDSRQQRRRVRRALRRWTRLHDFDHRTVCWVESRPFQPEPRIHPGLNWLG